MSNIESSTEGYTECCTIIAIPLYFTTIYTAKMKLSFVLLSAFGASAYAASGLCVADHYKLTAGECVVGGTVYVCDSEFPCTGNYNVSGQRLSFPEATAGPDSLLRMMILFKAHYQQYVDRRRFHLKIADSCLAHATQRGRCRKGPWDLVWECRTGGKA